MQITVPSRIEDIVKSVHEEFDSKAELFKPIALPMNALNCADFEGTKTAGAYVFVHEDMGCIKVGKSHSNASKRALQHCGSDNTSSGDGAIEMSKLLNCDKTHLLVFSLQKNESIHWVLALEHYLENTLKPRIPSKRNG
jgi:hypothetical protein